MKKISINIHSDKFFTPKELAERWRWHPESIRRKIRRREITTVVLGRRRLIPLVEIHKIEENGLVAAPPLSSTQRTGQKCPRIIAPSTTIPT
jgi:hypothetical protein